MSSNLEEQENNPNTIHGYNPDAGVDSVEGDGEKNTTTIHGYNPDTHEHEYSVVVDIDEVDATEKNTTQIPIPEYNEGFETIAFDSTKQVWEVSTIVAPLTGPKTSALRNINGEMLRTLSRISTRQAQSAGLYELKYSESIEYIEAGKPTDISNYPFLEACTSISKIPVDDYANTIIEKHNEYTNTLLNIEKIRMRAKVKIAAIEYNGSGDINILIKKINTIAEAAVEELFNL